MRCLSVHLDGKVFAGKVKKSVKFFLDMEFAGFNLR